VVFTAPVPIADIAYQNKAVVCDLLFKAAAETLVTIAADLKHPEAYQTPTGRVIELCHRVRLAGI
jgi:hypothetical protein